MGNLINWEIIEKSSMYEQLKNRLAHQKLIDINNLFQDYNSDELEEQLNYLEQDYKLYNRNLELTVKLDELNSNQCERYIVTLIKIEHLNNLPERQKLKMMIMYSMLVKNFSCIFERTTAEIFMLTACSTELDLEDCIYYIEILSDERVSKTIVGQVDNLAEQVKIAQAVMDSLDEFPYDCITAENYDILVNYSLALVLNYKFERIK